MARKIYRTCRSANLVLDKRIQAPLYLRHKYIFFFIRCFYLIYAIFSIFLLHPAVIFFTLIKGIHFNLSARNSEFCPLFNNLYSLFVQQFFNFTQFYFKSHFFPLCSLSNVLVPNFFPLKINFISLHVGNFQE